MAIMAPVFIGVAGLSVETGYWYFLQEKAQTAADVSAYAGALSLRNGDGEHSARHAARIEAAVLGYNYTTSYVAANTPPQAGAFINPQAMEVVIKYSPPRFFSAIFNQGSPVHSVRSVAAFAQPGKACILALHHDAPAAMSLGGSSTVTVTGCELMSNSVASNAFTVGGSVNVVADCINAVGGYEETGGSLSVNL